MGKKDYYLVLGISPGESSAGIRSAYRELAKLYHPDRSGTDGKKRFQEISEAYHTLIDPELRRAYDREIEATKIANIQRKPTEYIHSGYGPELLVPQPKRRNLVKFLDNREGVFPSAYAMPARFEKYFSGLSVPESERPETLNVEVMVSAADALHGILLDVELPRFSACPTCRGSGWSFLFPCPSCDSRGIIEGGGTIRLQVPAFSGNCLSLRVPLGDYYLRNLWLCLRVYVRRQN